MTLNTHDATVGTPPHDDPCMVPWTEDAMLRSLWRHFAGQSWAAVPQVTVAEHNLAPVGAAGHEETSKDRRIDMLAVRRPRRTDLGPLETLAVEVKVTRPDFLIDVRNPAKQAAWRQAATRHAYATPAGLVSPEEVPEGSGLLAVKHSRDGWGNVEWVRKAPYVDGHVPDLPDRVTLAALYRIAYLEGHTRGWNAAPLAAGTPQELRAAVKAAEDAAGRAERELERVRGQATAWKDAYLMVAVNGHPCRWCGEPVKPLRPGRDGFKSWRHMASRNDAPCLLMERAAREADARTEYDQADADTRDWQVRNAHYRHPNRFDAAVEKEPWRAFLQFDRTTRDTRLTGAEPCIVLPGNVTG